MSKRGQSGVRLEGLCKRFGQLETLKELRLQIEEGTFTVLVGPSGCGKTTTLRLIAGLEQPSAGRIFIGDRDVTHLEPKDRNVAMVFQNYALYPHMTVFENMAFGLLARQTPRSEIDRQVRQAAAILDIEALLDRRPRELSGGQQQRVAIGRALVRDPAVFLFDEPLSNLDARLRVGMRTELLKLHRKLGATTIYVTHDQEEAMTMGDNIVVMDGGVVQQSGTPRTVFFAPVNLAVAGFVGSPPMNLVPGVWADGAFDAGSLHLPLAMDGTPGRALTLGIRPEDIHLPGTLAANREAAAIAVTVQVVELLGPRAIVTMSLDGVELKAVLDERQLGTVREGERLSVVFDRDRLHLFDTASGRRCGPPRQIVSTTKVSYLK